MVVLRIRDNDNPDSCRRAGESGQTMLFVLLALSVFLLGAVAFAVDLGNAWFHRQNARSAADAACTAGAMDMLSTLNGTSAGGFTAGTDFQCSGNSTYAPCQYAALNDYSAPGLSAGTPSNEVNVTFPSTLAGVASCGGATPPPECTASAFTAHPYMLVTVTDRIQSFFIGLLSGTRTIDVRASSACGVVLSNAPIPIMVLGPTGTTLSFSGSPPLISIYGGPQRSIQVNSSSASAVSGGGHIDLHQGGPNLTGGDLGVTGTQGSCCSFNGGTSGAWDSSAAPISDPYATLATPSNVGLPALSAPYQTVGAGVNGCPLGSGGCDEYQGGVYAAGIEVKNANAIFDPGVYYITGGKGFTMGPNSCVRPSTLAGNGSGGTMFYFSGTASVSVIANAGSCSAAFSTTTGTGSLANGIKCTAASTVPGNIPATIADSILLGPCTGTYGDPLGTLDPVGEQHGMLFFQNRASGGTTGVTADWGGGGQFLLAGTMYFHQCVITGSDTGLGCTANAFNHSVSLGGNSCSGSFVVGEIITDSLSMHGNPCITMDLNKNAVHYVTKAALLQ